MDGSDPALAEFFRKMQEIEDREVRDIWRREWMAQAAPASLVRVLLDRGDDMETRREAAEALHWKNEAVEIKVPALIEVLLDRDDDAALRAKAAFTLGVGISHTELSVAAAVPALSEAMLDRNADTGIRCKAADAIGWIASTGLTAVAAAAPALIGVVSAPDDNAQVRRLAAQALGKFGACHQESAAAAVPALSAALRDPGSDAQVREAAGYALASLHAVAAPAVPALVEVLLEGGAPAQVRGSAEWALRRIGGEVVLDELLGKIQNGTSLDFSNRRGRVPPAPPPESEPESPEPPAATGPQAVEQVLGRTAELAARLRGWVSHLPADPEEKARAVLAVRRALDEQFREGLRESMRPVIVQLLGVIPPDYRGKQERAALVNGLLDTLNLAVVVRDADGHPHECGLQAVRARESDERGNLRLQDRRTGGGGRPRRIFAIPPLEELKVSDLPHQGEESSRATRGRGR